MPMLLVKEISLPDHYVRGAIRPSNVNDLMTVVINHNNAESAEELIKKKEISWPFDAIEVVRNEKAVENEKKFKAFVDALKEHNKDKNKAKKIEEKDRREKTIKAVQKELDKIKAELKSFKLESKNVFPYEIIDGGHRWTVAKRLKISDIEAKIRDIPNHGERYLEQYKLNSAHGLRLDKDQRDNAIRTLVKEFKIPQNALIKETGLTTASISRIVADKQRTGLPKKKGGGRPRNNSQLGSSPPISDMSPEGFVDRLNQIIIEFPRLEVSLGKMLESKPISAEKLFKFIQLLEIITKFFNNFKMPIVGATGSMVR